MQSLCVRLTFLKVALVRLADKCGVNEEKRQEMRTLVLLAYPVCITYILSFCLILVNMMVVGRVGAKALASVALGNLYANATGNSIIYGTASACDTLQSQAIGARNFKRVGAITQRGIAIILLLCIPVALVWLKSDLVLGNLGQDEETADLAIAYVRILIFGLPPAATYEILKKHLQSFGLMVPPMLINGFAIILNALLGYILVFHTDLSFYGAAVAFATSNWCMLGAMLSYYRWHRPINRILIRWKLLSKHLQYSEAKTETPAEITSASLAIDVGPEVDLSSIDASGASDTFNPLSGPSQQHVNSTNSDAATATKAHADTQVEKLLSADDMLELTWTGWSKADALSGWREFIMLGIPSAAMLFIEWGSFEVAALISGLVSTYTLAAHTIMANTAGLCFMPVLGLGVAAGIRTGNLMGERQPKAAVQTFRVVLVMTLMYVCVSGLFIVSVKGVWGYVFTSDPIVIDLLDQWLFILGFFTVFDALQCVCSGVLRGVGRPGIAAAANVLAYVVIGLPLGYVLTIVAGWGLPGVWTSFFLAVTVAAAVLSAALNCLNWEKASAAAHARALQGAPTSAAGSKNVEELNTSSEDASPSFEAELAVLSGTHDKPIVS